MRARKSSPSLAPYQPQVAKDWLTAEEYMLRVETMSVAELHGQLLSFAANVKSGTMPPSLQKALIRVDSTRQGEIREYVADVAQMRNTAWAQNMAHMRVDQAAEDLLHAAQ